MSCMQWAIFIEIIGIILTAVSIFLKIGWIKTLADKIKGITERMREKAKQNLKSLKIDIRKSPSEFFESALIETFAKLWHTFVFSGLGLIINSCVLWMCIIPINKLRLKISNRHLKKHPNDIRGKREINKLIELIKNAREIVGPGINIGFSYIFIGMLSLIYLIVSPALIIPEKIVVFITSRITTNWCIGIGTFIIIVSLVFQLVLTP